MTALDVFVSATIGSETRQFDAIASSQACDILYTGVGFSNFAIQIEMTERGYCVYETLKRRGGITKRVEIYEQNFRHCTASDISLFTVETRTVDTRRIEICTR